MSVFARHLSFFSDDETMILEIKIQFQSSSRKLFTIALYSRLFLHNVVLDYGSPPQTTSQFHNPLPTDLTTLTKNKDCRQSPSRLFEGNGAFNGNMHRQWLVTLRTLTQEAALVLVTMAAYITASEYDHSLKIQSICQERRVILLPYSE